MKTIITKQQFTELVGILALADHEMKILNTLNDAAHAITGEKDDWGHTADAIWDDNLRDAKKLLRKLKIIVKK
ncbi:MAG: hypothetical protein C4586_08705 [Anaerolineaceae bacterium]|nr:MAG: hypothetical protein C4586_08705 [Anaerolineaceae bacterium]